MDRLLSRDEFMKLVRRYACMKVAAYQRYTGEGAPDDFAEFAQETAATFELILEEHDKLLTQIEKMKEELQCSDS